MHPSVGMAPNAAHPVRAAACLTQRPSWHAIIAGPVRLWPGPTSPWHHVLVLVGNATSVCAVLAAAAYYGVAVTYGVLHFFFGLV